MSMLEIKKRVRHKEIIIARLADLDALAVYTKRHSARIGCLGDQLRVEFLDGSTCDACLREFNPSRWLDRLVAAQPRRLVKAQVAHFRCVVLNETRHWADEIVQKAGGQIWTAYLYDAGCHTYCCELTPSYWLRHVCSTPLVDDEEGSLSETIRVAEACGENDGYYHVRLINGMRSSHFTKDFGLQLIDETGNDGPKRSELEEEHLEYLQGNGGYELPQDISASGI